MSWTRDEDQSLTTLWESGATVPEIAKRLEKNPSTVKARRKSLGLKPRRTGDLTEKVKVGLPPDTMTILRQKAKRNGQTIPGRIRALVMRDCREP